MCFIYVPVLLLVKFQSPSSHAVVTCSTGTRKWGRPFLFYDLVSLLLLMLEESARQNPVRRVKLCRVPACTCPCSLCLLLH